MPAGRSTKGTAGRRFRLPAVPDGAYRSVLGRRGCSVRHPARCVGRHAWSSRLGPPSPTSASRFITGRPGTPSTPSTGLCRSSWARSRPRPSPWCWPSPSDSATGARSWFTGFPAASGAGCRPRSSCWPPCRASSTASGPCWSSPRGCARSSSPPWPRSPAVHGPFSGPQLGVGPPARRSILFVMVLPTMVAISRDVIAGRSDDQIEGAFALGATRWQVLWRVVVPSARVGMLGAITLATGRALGETIAVTMVIGNSTHIAHSLFSPAATLASMIANQFTEATEPFHLSSLMALGLILMVIAVIVNVAARLLVRSVRTGAHRRWRWCDGHDLDRGSRRPDRRPASGDPADRRCATEPAPDVLEDRARPSAGYASWWP